MLLIMAQVQWYSKNLKFTQDYSIYDSLQSLMWCSVSTVKFNPWNKTDLVTSWNENLGNNGQKQNIFISNFVFPGGFKLSILLK